VGFDLTSGRGSRIVAVALVVLLLVCLFRGSAVADTPSAGDQEASSERIASAWSHLARGEAKRAYREFAREVPFWDTVARQSRGYLDCARGMMIAAIFMRDDALANAMWKQIGGGSLEPAADRLVFAGRWNDAFRAYRDATQDLAMVNPRANTPDPVIAAGVARALQGDFRGAIRAWSKPAVGGGPYDLTDKQTHWRGSHVRDWAIGQAPKQRGSQRPERQGSSLKWPSYMTATPWVSRCSCTFGRILRAAITPIGGHFRRNLNDAAFHLDKLGTKGAPTS